MTEAGGADELDGDAVVVDAVMADFAVVDVMVADDEGATAWPEAVHPARTTANTASERRLATTIVTPVGYVNS